MYQLVQIEKKEYDELAAQAQLQFLQQSYWAQLREAIGEYKYEFYKILGEEQKTVGQFVLLVKEKKIGFIKIKAGYIPRTVFFYEVKEALKLENIQTILRKIKSLAHLSLVEFAYPHWDVDAPSSDVWFDNINALVKKSKFNFVQKEIQPKATIIKETFLEDLIASFPSSNARRNIKRGLKEFEASNLEFVTQSKLSPEELEYVYELILANSQEKKFTNRNLQYFQKMQEICPNTIWYIFRDKTTKEIILANLAILDSSTSTNYDLYVGKKGGYDKMYLSYLLKYFSFQYLKENGYKYYDHWGIDLDPKSPKYQFSVFKLHFGGRIVHYPKIILVTKFGQSLVKRIIKYII